MKLLVSSTLLNILLFLLNVYFTNAICNQYSCGNGKCVTKGFDSKCVCKPGFFGNHCLQRNCSQNKYRCGQHGTCNSATGFCACHYGYKGRYCNYVSDCNNMKCKHQGVCQLNNSRYECLCQEGFEGRFCEVICLPCAKNNSCFACPSNQLKCNCTNDQKYVNKTEKNNSVTIYKNAGLKPEVYIVISLLAFLTFVAAVASITKYRKKYYRLDESSMGTDLIAVSELTENL